MEVCQASSTCVVCFVLGLDVSCIRLLPGALGGVVCMSLNYSLSQCPVRAIASILLCGRKEGINCCFCSATDKLVLFLSCVLSRLLGRHLLPPCLRKQAVSFPLFHYLRDLRVSSALGTGARLFPPSGSERGHRSLGRAGWDFSGGDLFPQLLA